MKALTFFRSFLIICVISAFGMACYAQQEEDPIFKLNNVTVPYGVYPCMADTDTLVLSLVDDFQPSVINSWTASGDLTLSVLTQDQRSVRIVSTGPARGAVTLNYDRAGCGSSSERLIINKSFAPNKYNLSIEGPECIISGQTVVYSVDPILTKHLNAQIGIDTYHWNVVEQQEQLSFVDELLYVSGDGSSITFSVGEIDQQNLPTITLNVGDCNLSNDRTLSLNLGNSTPVPDVTDTIFVPYGTAPFVVKLNTSNPDIAYTWECSDSVSFDIFRFDSQDSIRITPQESAKSADCKVFVTGEFRNITCNTSSDTIHIIRSWGEHIELKAENNETCFTMGNRYKFSVSGDIPLGSECSWTIPQGWSLIGDNDKAQYIYLTPTASAYLVDTLRVRPLNARDTARVRTYVVHVKPATIDHINEPGCIAVNGGVNKCYIDTIGLRPAALSFEWDIPADSIVSGQGTDTIYFKGGDDITSIGVTAKGKDGCDADIYIQNLSLPPVPPAAVISNNTCLWADSTQQVTLSVSNPEVGQRYAWSVPNWNPQYNSDSTSVTLTTNGIRGNYPVSVWAVGSGECSQSTAANYTIVVDTMDWSIGFDEGRKGIEFFLEKNGEEDETNQVANWTLLGTDTIVYDNNQISTYWSKAKQLLSVTAVLNVDGCIISLELDYSNSRGFSNYSRKRETLGKEEIRNEGNIIKSISPNPARDIINLQLFESQTYMLLIFDAKGQLVMRKRIIGEADSIDVSPLSSGVYTFVLSDRSNHESRQVIIN